MATFCSKCGTRLTGGAFCGACGSPVAEVPAGPASPAAPPSVAPPPAMYAAPAVPPPPLPPPAPQVLPGGVTPGQLPLPGAAKSSSALKVILIVLVLLFALGAAGVAGLFYAAHRVRQRVREIQASLPSDEAYPGRRASSDSGITGDPCRFLSKAEVSAAVGVEIVAAEPSADGCSYLAKGDSADMTARHVTALAGTQGANAQQQQMIRGMAGGLFKSSQEENHESGSDANGNTPVFIFGVQDQSAQMQMSMTRKVMGALGPSLHDLPGVGDEAFDVAGAMMMVRKGDKLIRIMYMTCPCNTGAVTPLAQKLAAAL